MGEGCRDFAVNPAFVFQVPRVSAVFGADDVAVQEPPSHDGGCYRCRQASDSLRHALKVVTAQFRTSFRVTSTNARLFSKSNLAADVARAVSENRGGAAGQ